eukprot:CAMPEP_0196773054 /NCGR_PEP_ID=MMETSP1104-20130614/2560_1 /TAXON_ID=33652 /ORGANISM="Cafeteria sp., Strain Caron Lab Isolate" /LENGTH=100 /DNA_ID=CAMNT_0042143199 /DNA_START=430 /DNA_END=732 /DNA_ORIENTATION=-
MSTTLRCLQCVNSLIHEWYAKDDGAERGRQQPDARAMRQAHDIRCRGLIKGGQRAHETGGWGQSVHLEPEGELLDEPRCWRTTIMAGTRCMGIGPLGAGK